MSSRRSRSGGTWIGKTLSRKNRSSRNAPDVMRASSGRLVAARKRTLTGLGRASPTGVISRCSMARSSLTWAAAGTSPSSSRSTVPPSASSSRPLRSTVAPVNAPRWWPKSSPSIRPGLSAARQTGKNARRLRVLWRWIARATSSLPVPLSPVMSTGTSLGATRAICL